MRYPRPRRRQERTKTIIMTGGLNDIVTDLELKEGELHQVRNYMELDSPYHGYTSVSGYERYDGKAKPSSIGINVHTDLGNDSDTLLLLEATTGMKDIIKDPNFVENFGVQVVQEPTKFEDGVFRFVNSAYALITSREWGAFSHAFFRDFDALFDTGTLPLDGDWQIDFQVLPSLQVAGGILMEAPGSWRIRLDASNFIVFEATSDGVTYDTVLQQAIRNLSFSLFTHVSLVSRNKVIRLSINGVPAEDGLGNIIEVPYTTIAANHEKIWLGTGVNQTSPFTGYLDEIRISGLARWYYEFIPPTMRYSATPAYKQILYYDKEREDQRALITEVPGIGPVRGVHIYQGEVYAKRDVDPGDGSDPVSAVLWKADTVYNGGTGDIDDSLSGWVLIDDTLNPGGRLDCENWRFSGAFGDRQVMCIVDGVSIPRIYDGLNATPTMHVLDGSYDGHDGSQVGAAVNLPDNDATDPRYAHIVSIFDNRLVLGYKDRDLFISAASDPGYFGDGFGAQLLTGDDVTNFQELPGESLGVFCRNSVKVIKKISQPVSQTNPMESYFFFDIESFSREAGALPWSAERVLDKIIYADDRGIVDLKATDKYGDFDAAVVSKKLNKIYLAKKRQVTTSLVDKQINQYRLYFDDGGGLYFTFLEEKVKGGTYVEFPNPVVMAVEGEDKNGDLFKFFTSNDGYVYQMDSGTSFDGEVINTELFTSYYHYASPRQWKTFRRMEFEVTADYGTQFAVRPVFNYDDSELPDTNWWVPLSKGFVGQWGGDNWGEFIWGGSPVQRAIHYVRGIGTNMSIEMRTASKYTENHIIHNAIVDYEVQEQQE